MFDINILINPYIALIIGVLMLIGAFIIWKLHKAKQHQNSFNSKRVLARAGIGIRLMNCVWHAFITFICAYWYQFLCIKGQLT